MKLKPKRACPVISVHTSELVSYAGISSLRTKGKNHEIRCVMKLAEFALYLSLENF